MSNKLSTKEEKFCVNVASGMDIVAAAKSAGYSARTSLHAEKTLMQMPPIKKRIDALTPDLERDLDFLLHDKPGVSVDTVLNDLKTAKRYAQEIYYDAQGNQRRSIGEFIKCVELEGKYLKMFNDKIEVNLQNNVLNKVDLSNVPDEALDKIEAILKTYESNKP